MSTLSPWIAGPLVVGTFLFLLWHELRHPLRKNIESKSTRQVRNFAIGALGAVASAAIETPLIQTLAHIVEARQWGLLGIFTLPVWVNIGITLLLMDYTFYVWHVLLHRVPFLWRFHAVHHVDLDMDTSTALRFHFGEVLASIPWRAAQVVVIGLTPFTFSIWQVWFILCVMFHHSNISIPIVLERLINRILVTPRMHAVHHSNVPEETNSNWSSGLTLWDWIHGTLRLNIPQQEIVIGVAAFGDPQSVALPRLLAMPFKKQPDYWRLDDGRTPAQRLESISPDQMLS